MKRETLKDILAAHAMTPEDERIARLEATVERANRVVRERARSLPVGAQPSDYLAVLAREQRRP